ncbi:hypothetical protein LTR08_000108 [Meristemomyces frigidus]|nr:hypothetical protein LTR08_000108 [Meristemomyces frigidus]
MVDDKAANTAVDKAANTADDKAANMADDKAANTAVTRKWPMKRARRMQLLTAETISDGSKTLYDKNATESPLLRCPPEVRNRIWYFALCGQTIHVTGKTRQGRPVIYHRACQAAVKDEDAFAGTQGEEMKDYAVRHAVCLQEDLPVKNSTIPVAVFRACRQIHQEAALLPYKHNTFAFQYLWDAVPFLQSLFSAQARAIEKLHLVPKGMYYDYSTKTCAKLLRGKLKGLKELTVEIEVMDTVRTADAFGMWGEKDRESMRKSLLQLRCLPAVSATVTMVLVETRLDWPSAKSSAGWLEVARDWAKEIEEELMRPAV